MKISTDDIIESIEKEEKEQIERMAQVLRDAGLAVDASMYKACEILYRASYRKVKK